MNKKQCLLTVFLALMICTCLWQVEGSYRVFILPEHDSFCPGVFTGDACRTWSNYSGNPTFAEDFTTLIFTPGTYSLPSSNAMYDNAQFSVNYLKHFSLIGDNALILFTLSLSNIEHVEMHNLSFSYDSDVDDYPLISVVDVDLFTMENCTLFQQNISSNNTLLLYDVSLGNIFESTLIETPIAMYQWSTLQVNQSNFTNSTQVILYADANCTVHINNSRFMNNSAHDKDIRMINVDGLLTIDNSLFEENVYNKLLLSTSENMQVMNSRFLNNVCFQSAAIINGPDINISNCTFAESTCGAVSNEITNTGNMITISNSNFKNINTGIGSGDCSSILFGEDVIIINSTFVNTSSGSCDGTVVWSQFNITVHNCTVVNSTSYGAPDFPGGIITAKYGDITITHSSIRDSYANGVGAIYSGGGQISIISCNITNTYSESGGAVACLANVPLYGKLFITDSIINNSSAASDGGALFIFRVDVTIINTRFINNKAVHGNGGAIYGESSSITCINCTFSGCAAPNGTGGAIYFRTYYPNIPPTPSFTDDIISQSTFNHNSATSGGALYIIGRYNYTMKFTDSTFTFNVIKGNITGGGVAVVYNASVSISHCVFNENLALTNGGVFDLKSTSVSVIQSTFSHNKAIKNGGVFHGRNFTTNFMIEKTTFENNDADSGGVFYVRIHGSNIVIMNGSVFTENSATTQGGVLDIRGVTLMIENSTVIGNNSAANVPRNVISECDCKITVHGLTVQPDSKYPQYCSVYNEVASKSKAPDLKGNKYEPYTRNGIVHLLPVAKKGKNTLK